MPGIGPDSIMARRGGPRGYSYSIKSARVIRGLYFGRGLSDHNPLAESIRDFRAIETISLGTFGGGLGLIITLHIVSSHLAYTHYIRGIREKGNWNFGKRGVLRNFFFIFFFPLKPQFQNLNFPGLNSPGWCA